MGKAANTVIHMGGYSSVDQHLFIDSSSEHLLSTFYESGAIQGTRDTPVTQPPWLLPPQILQWNSLTQ